MLSRFKIYLIALFALGLSGCEKGPHDPESKPGEGNIPVQLILGRMGYPSVTRTEVQGGAISIKYNTGDTASLTRSIADDPDYVIGDIVVLQFDAAGDLISGDHIADLSSITPTVSGQLLIYSPTLTLQQEPSSTVYIIANTGSAALFSTVQTLDDLELLTRAIPDESSIRVSGLLPMTGSYTGPVNEETDIRIELERMFAKFEVTVNIGQLDNGRTLSLENIRLKSVPVAALYAHTYKGHNFDFSWSATTPVGYPQVPGPTSQVIDLSLFTDYGEQQLVTDNKMIFYTPENIRGRGRNSGGEQIYKSSDSDATASYFNSWPTETKWHEKGVATRLWLTGKYTTADNQDMDILMTIYPGDDIYNDYNVRRNTLYDIEININDVDPAWVNDEEKDYNADHRIYVWSAEGEKERSATPVFDRIYAMAMSVTGQGVTGATVTVIFPNGSALEAIVDLYGKWMVASPMLLRDGEVLVAYQTEDGKLPSDEVTTTVGGRN